MMAVVATVEVADAGAVLKAVSDAPAVRWFVEARIVGWSGRGGEGVFLYCIVKAC